MATSRGRPKLDVDTDLILQQWRLGKTMNEASVEFGISRETFRRIVNDKGLSRKQTPALTNDDVDKITLEVKCFIPNAGERLIIGHFKAGGYNIQRHKIRASIQRVDPDGVIERRDRVTRRIARRVYRSPFPHYCWHIDGNHKLIRWGLVVHCAVDGFSRACTYMKCSNNNKALTVYEYFVTACEEFAVPMRVRTDLGGENQLVWNGMMELANEHNRNPVAVGSSVHNQRVERFNRDINSHIRARFGDLFYSFERSGFLNIENKVDIAALHFVYLPRINAVLDTFRASHNNHPISTEHNNSPVQLIEKFVHLYNNRSIEPVMDSDDASHSSDIPAEPSIVLVTPPAVGVDFSEDNYLSTVDVKGDDGADGRHIFLAVKERFAQILGDMQ